MMVPHEENEKSYEGHECSVIRVTYHMGGTWERKRYLRYINGKCHVVKGDINFLSYTDMLNIYRNDFDMPVEKLCYLRPRKKVKDGELTILDGDDGINDIIATFMDLDIEKWKSNWSSSSITRYQLQNKRSFGCEFYFNGEDGYEVDDRFDRHEVRLESRSCSCRFWDLTGIPCRHAIVAINHSKQDPKTFISPWYEKAAFIATYKTPMQPVKRTRYINTDGIHICEPPPHIRLAGRPRVKRIRSAGEKKKGQRSGVLGKKGITMTCSICQSSTHNKTSCHSFEEMDKSSNKGKEKVVDNQKGKSKETTSMKRKEQVKSQPLDKVIRRTRRLVGIGLYVDDSTGNTIYNPGMTSETIVEQRDPIATQPLPLISDPTIRYPIPNEQLIIQEKEASRLSNRIASRKIAFANSEPQVILPRNFPFKPPGPTWRGKPCTTASQLVKQRDNLQKSKKL